MIQLLCNNNKNNNNSTYDFAKLYAIKREKKNKNEPTAAEIELVIKITPSPYNNSHRKNKMCVQF